jgi:hypothetical protein
MTSLQVDTCHSRHSCRPAVASNIVARANGDRRATPAETIRWARDVSLINEAIYGSLGGYRFRQNPQTFRGRQCRLSRNTTSTGDPMALVRLRRCHPGEIDAQLPVAATAR